MNKLPNLIASISALTAVLAWGIPAQAQSESVSLPISIGRVVDEWSAQGGAEQATLYLVQDAHVNFEAQKNIASILEYLAEDHEAGWIFVEGGFGDSNLDALRRRGSAAMRRRVADQYLESGMISGAEYVDLVSPKELHLWGVEDPDLYALNFQAFAAVKDMRRSASDEIAALRQLIAELQAEFYSDELKRHVELLESYQEGSIETVDYLKELNRLAPDLLERSVYPAIWSLWAADRLAQSIDLDKVNQEQRVLVKEYLQPALSPESFSKLKEISTGVREGTHQRLDFYRELERLSELAGLEWPQDSQLSQYLSKLKLYEQVNVMQAAKELPAYAAAVGDRLVRGDLQAMVVKLSGTAERIDRLFDLAWSSEDYGFFQENASYFSTAKWTQLITTLETIAGKSFSVEWNAGLLDRRIDKALNFYAAAMERDRVIFDKAMGQFESSDQKTASLVVGGFHTDNLSRLFSDAGFRVVVISPKVLEEEGGRLKYERVLAEKFERGLKMRQKISTDTGDGLFAGQIVSQGTLQ